MDKAGQECHVDDKKLRLCVSVNSFLFLSTFQVGTVSFLLLKADSFFLILIYYLQCL